jgi:GT2 family glycosyltransferase
VKPISVVITTKNGYTFTRHCLESLTWTLPRSAYEVIIVDNGSTDETSDLRESHDVRFIENRGNSLYGSWNMGIREARTEFVAVVNNDIAFLTRDWSSWLCAALTGDLLDWAFPLVIESQAPVFSSYDHVTDADVYPSLQVETRTGWFEACCFVIRRELLEDIGPFDEDFEIWYGEKDYEIRLLAAGRRYGAVRNAVIRHFGSSTLRVGFQERRKFEEDTGQLPQLNERALRDYHTFRAKWGETDLSSLGLRMPEFGRVPLAPGDGSGQ